MSASPQASRLLAQALRRGAPGLTRAVLTTLLDPRRRRAIADALARLEDHGAAAVGLLGPAPRHPMAPAAVRVERTRSRGRRGEEAEQLAVTMWFGEGPVLPAPGGRLGRGAVRVGAGVVSAAAVAAATTLVTRLGEKPSPRLLPAASPRRLPAGHTSLPADAGAEQASPAQS